MLPSWVKFCKIIPLSWPHIGLFFHSKHDSNEELKYLQKVVAGEQRLEPEAVKRILVSAEKKVQKNLARLQAQTAAGATGAALPIGPVTPVAAPAPTKRYNPQTRKIESISGD